MQQKRDDQQKSIDAYYRTNDPNYQPFYTALLSQVASELYKRITLCTLVKDDIEHHDVFHGKEAVVNAYYYIYTGFIIYLFISISRIV
jgi:hypothetical protein